MPSIWKRLSHPKAEPYQFLQTEELLPEEEEFTVFDPEEALTEKEEFSPAFEEEQRAQDPVGYAQIQAERIVADAKRQAEEILSKAREEARQHTEEIYESARKDGVETGRAEGLEAGFAQAMAENQRAREEESAALAAEIQKFLDKADAALNQQLDDNVGQLRDLAIAVAEKVVSVSLRSSSEVIGRMIQTAVDKRRRREWVHIYIAECDARHLTQMPAALVTALSALSDRVRIIPMADDEAGTCIIEMPDEIVDASASTQLNNIRSMLSDMPVGTRDAAFQRRRSVDRVPTNGPSGL